MKKADPFKMMDLALKHNNFQGIPSTVRARYISMLVSRAVRLYIESELDSLIIDEDLADGASDTGFYESGAPLRKSDLCNLIYGEEYEAKFQQSLLN
jgi:hypothetical protein